MSVRTDILKSSEVLDKIKQLLDQSEQLDIAVAYLKRTGLNLLKPEITDFLENERKIRLVVGIQTNQITDGEALQELLEWGEDYEGSISVRYIHHKGFHPKLYLFRRGEKLSAIIGSSNLTKGGFKDNVELNILLEGDVSNPTIRKINEFFEAIWKGSDFLDYSVTKELSKDHEILEELEKRKEEIETHWDIPITPIAPLLPRRRPKLQLITPKQEEVIKEWITWFSKLLAEADEACRAEGLQKHRARGCYYSCPKQEEEGCYLGNAIYQNTLPDRVRELRLNIQSIPAARADEIVEDWMMIYSTRPELRVQFEENREALESMFAHIGDEGLNLTVRYDDVASGSYRIKGIGAQTLTQFFASVNKDEYIVLHDNILEALKRWEFKFPTRIGSIKGKYYAKINAICKELLELFEETYGIGLPLVHYFLWLFVKEWEIVEE